jgi:hypothetical protein
MAKQKIFVNQDFQGLAIEGVVSNAYADLATAQAKAVASSWGTAQKGLLIYDKATGLEHRWDGTQFVAIPASQELKTIIDNTLTDVASVVALSTLRPTTIYKNDLGAIFLVDAENTVTQLEDGKDIGEIVFNSVAFVADTEVVFDLNADATIASQFGNAQAGTVEVMDNKFFLATGLAIYETGGTQPLNMSPVVRAISDSTFGVTVGIAGDFTIAVSVLLKKQLTTLFVKNQLASSSIAVTNVTVAGVSFDPILNIASGVEKQTAKIIPSPGVETLTFHYLGLTAPIVSATAVNGVNAIVGTVTDLTGGNYDVEFLAVDLSKDLVVTLL